MGIKEGLRKSPLARAAQELVVGLGAVSDSSFKSIIRNLDSAEVHYVLDIGANVGQFGIDIRRHGYRGQIISFEPVNDTFNRLTKTIKRHQPWSAIQIGLSSSESKQTINVSANAGLSTSFLTMGPVHLENFPESKTVSTELVRVSTIDKQLEVLGLNPKDVMLKLDVQGYEAEVLKGASKSLSKIPLCYLEVSILALYEGEVTFLPILNMLKDSGHEVIDIFRGIKAKNGELLQLDILTKLISK